ncbi:uncharacterized protein LOC111862536 isoform X2 [Cryptotermes secundus]|uniref:uncharacterized protein LOC111862536 isoform X2 n=1 Tax=Cryptotermes secundus TaxID=105785 RepID=UPI000CD7B2BD|nr:uncharacterized protein LOC111862536 isoform X2 [Cryptotermes secundus]
MGKSLIYIRAGLSAVVLIHIYLLNVEFMRICYSLNQSKVVKSGFMWNFTCLLFVIHYLLWGGVFLSTVLQSYLLSALNVRMSDDSVSSFVVLHAALWSYISLEIFSAPAMKLIYYCVWLTHSYDHRDWLDYALFPPYNDEIRRLKEIRRNVRLEKAQSLEHYFRIGEQPESETKSSKNSRALYQTVRCVMALKRRIRRKRAAQSLVFSTSEQLETTDSSGVQSNM